jgi:hypothetical protein
MEGKVAHTFGDAFRWSKRVSHPVQQARHLRLDVSTTAFDRRPSNPSVLVRSAPQGTPALPCAHIRRRHHDGAGARRW